MITSEKNAKLDLRSDFIDAPNSLTSSAKGTENGTENGTEYGTANGSVVGSVNCSAIGSLPNATTTGRFDANTEVQKRFFIKPELLLDCGVKLTNVQVGYETYGQLNQDKSNAIMVSHYFTGNSHAAGRYKASDAEPGYWDNLIGPGKGIDTDRYFVIATDSLCNLCTKNPMVITTGPATVRTETGLPWGAEFPVITLGDNVELQKFLCELMGIQKLHAVAGPSMGSLQTMEWTARFPNLVDRALCFISAGLSTDAYLIALLNTWMAPIRLDPNFRNGNYYGHEEPLAGLTEALKLVTFNAVHFQWAQRLYGRRWAEGNKNPALRPNHEFSIEVALQQTANARALVSDANSFLRLARKVQLFNIADRKGELRAKYLFVPAATDLLMFPQYAYDGVNELKALGLDAGVVEIPGDGGHLDGLANTFKVSERVRSFLDS